MKEYICVKTGITLSEEALQYIFRMNGSEIFNERDYESWKREIIIHEVIKEA